MSVRIIPSSCCGAYDDELKWYIIIGIHTSNNITLVGDTTVVFFFGSRVLIPNDNLRVDDDQCFTIGLDCTVKNLPSLVQGKEITFEAYIETDFDVRTQTERIYPVVSEPVLLCDSGMCPFQVCYYFPIDC